ncbi:MAG: hypothetical protein R3B95_08255 [Nitrospirales bacterium]|nr:hypothetical protein [Nitrospirales bacterium]
MKPLILEKTHRYYSQPFLVLSVIGGPPKPILRPSEIEKPQLARDLLQAALFGPYPFFDHGMGNKQNIDNSTVWSSNKKTVNDCLGSMLRGIGF